MSLVDVPLFDLPDGAEVPPALTVRAWWPARPDYATQLCQVCWRPTSLQPCSACLQAEDDLFKRAQDQ